jgi:hypothetical protein
LSIFDAPDAVMSSIGQTLPVGKIHSGDPTRQPEDQMQILTNTDRNVTGSEGLAAQAHTIVGNALARFSDQIARVEAHLSDENGPRDGVEEERCRIEGPMRTTETIADPAATGVEATVMMHALVYGGPDQRAWQAKPKPLVRDPGDAVVRITTSTICGTDLHILKGDVPTVTAGRILGHEGIGVIEDVGLLVSTFRKGDRVLISCVSACGICDFCRRGMYSHCRTGGWILGNTIDGTHAECLRYVRERRERTGAQSDSHELTWDVRT